MAADPRSHLYTELRPLLFAPVEVKRDGSIMSRCPCHDDCSGKGGKKPRPSLALYPTGALKCFAGCDFKAVLVALRARDQRPRRGVNTVTPARVAPRTPMGQPVATYAYGRVEKARFEPPGGSKTFRFRKTGTTAWGGLDGVLESELPLYHAAEIIATPLGTPIVFCEGEKAADAAREHEWMATCNVGGASQVDFGTSLDLLRGKDVWLWPDNDPPGFTLMARLGVALRRTAARVRIIDVPLPYKGDAADFFKSGGTNDQIREGVTDREAIKWVADDAITVSLPSAAGLLTWEFTDIEYQMGLEFDLRVEVTGHAWDFGPIRLNMSTLSAQASLHRELEAALPVAFDKGTGETWAQFVNVALTRLRNAYEELPRLVSAIDLPVVSEQRYLIQGLIREGRPTVFYGPGGHSKSYLMLRMAFALAMGEPFYGMRTQQTPVIYADWEDTLEEFNLRLHRLYAGLGFEPDSVPVDIHYWPAGALGSIDQQIRELRRVIERTGARAIFIDSAGRAAPGSEPDKAESAIRFYNAVKRLPAGITAIPSAHVTKAAAENGGSALIKGAVEWQTGAAMAWQITSNAEPGEPEFDLKLACTKANGLWPRSLAFHVRHVGEAGPVTFTPIEAASVPEFVAMFPPRQQIRAYLEQAGQANTVAIAEALGIPDNRVRTELGADQRTFVQITKGVKNHPAVWGLRAAPHLDLGAEIAE